MLGEGPVPGVIGIPEHITGHQWDWRQPYEEGVGETELPEGSLFGLLGSGGMGGLGGFSGLGGPIDDITAFLDGTRKRELDALRAEYDKNFNRVNALALDIKKMPEGPAKTEAVRKWDQMAIANSRSFQSFVQAVRKYNEMVGVIRQVPLAAEYAPETVSVPGIVGMSGMGLAPIAIAAAAVARWAVANAFSIAALVLVFGSAVSSFRQESSQVRTIGDQIEGIIRATGQIPTNIGTGIKDILIGTTELSKTLLIGGAVLGGGYIVYKLLQGAGKIR
jgi:hypothetical protein